MKEVSETKIGDQVPTSCSDSVCHQRALPHSGRAPQVVSVVETGGDGHVAHAVTQTVQQ